MATDALVQKPVDGFDGQPARPDTEAEENRAGVAGRMTRELFPYETLFSPVGINGLTLKNRIVMAPMDNAGLCGESGRPGDAMLAFFFARASGGAGLLITGPVPVRRGPDSDVTGPGGLSCYPRIDRSRTVFSGWRDLAAGVHAHGARIFIQLSAGPGRADDPWADVPDRALSGRELGRILAAIGQAAADARAMGLDGVCLRGRAGSPVEQGSSPGPTRGGRGFDPARFGVDAVREIRRRVGPDFPILYCIWLSPALAGRGGAAALAHMAQLVEAGVDAFDVGPDRGDEGPSPAPAGLPAGCFLEAARAARDYFAEKNILSGAGLPVLVAGAGKLGYPDVAERALRAGDCDLVLLGRPLLADPAWPDKARAGQVEAIRPCIGCGAGCLKELAEGGHTQCAVNPRAGFEALLPEPPAPTMKKKKIAVVGAGPGGVMAAVTAAQRGHSVTLYEKSGRVGGRLVAGSVPRIKFDLENYRLYLERLVKEAVRRYGLAWRPATEAGAESLREEGFEAILFATGARHNPPVSGFERAGAIGAAELLLAPEKLGGARDILVAGGGAVGCEVAGWLAGEQGRRVMVVEKRPRFLENLCAASRGHLLHTLKAAGVRLLAGAELIGVEAGRATIRRNGSESLPDPSAARTPLPPEKPAAPQGGEACVEESLEADLVVLATGGRADDTLYFEALETAAAPELYSLGDSFEVGGVLEAVRGGYRLGGRV